ncbi:MAG: LysE family transporter [Thermodesulfobacteriota bacterium]
MTNYILAGTLLGLSAGFAPGPLLTLVISETLRHNTRAGIKVALAPIITDLPIIALCVFLLDKLSSLNTVLAVISIIGGMVVLAMGLQGLRTKGTEIFLDEVRPRSLLKGVTVNIFSPYPYLFWLSVGSPIMLKAADLSLLAAAGFVGTFYLFLVGAKLLLAVLTGRSRAFLSGRAYLLTMKLLGLLLVFFSFFLFREGWMLYTG